MMMHFEASVNNEKGERILKYGNILHSQGIIPNNTKYAITKYLLDQAAIAEEAAEKQLAEVDKLVQKG